ncbi:MAG: Hsp20/alpha crystallin family protein [Eubacteriales bacterium]|nr:Hsp20/alpha crystallin family protein [Eubacteriales bacterium]
MFGMIPFEYRDHNPFDMIDNFERSFFKNSSMNLPTFRTDIKDAGDKYILQAELPGFQKEDISLDVKDGILTISAQHNENNDQKDDDGTYIRRERRYGSFRRSFDVSGIDESSIAAAYRNGVLELSLPKMQQVLPESRKIAIE